MRYRADRYDVDDLRLAPHAARHAGAPLTLAAAAVAAGFLSFLPTDYRGVSELGQIAGMGMIVAYFTSITLLPALLKVLNPPGEPEPLGFAFLAPVDRFMERHRIAIIAGTAIVSLGGLPLLYFMKFDFNPINLRNPHVESIATFLDLRKDPATGASSINVMVPSLEQAAPVAERLAKVPEVSRVTTLNFFVPQDQERKLAALAVARDKLAPSFKPEAAQQPPTDEENVTALNEVVTALNEAAEKHANGPGALAAKRLAANLDKLAKATPQVRARVEAAFTRPLKTALDDLKDLMRAHTVTLAELPPGIVEQWRRRRPRARRGAAEGRSERQRDVAQLSRRGAVAVEPDATGGPISIPPIRPYHRARLLRGGRLGADLGSRSCSGSLKRFGGRALDAGAAAARRRRDAGAVRRSMPLNFANIIALPLLFGIGVAFNIYFVMAWRAGQIDLLQSSLTRAVFYSALTTATAFGSLWLSSHPGTSSMGKLLALSLLTTLAAAVLFQPVLMGKPRQLGDM